VCVAVTIDRHPQQPGERFPVLRWSQHWSHAQQVENLEKSPQVRVEQQRELLVEYREANEQYFEPGLKDADAGYHPPHESLPQEEVGSTYPRSTQAAAPVYGVVPLTPICTARLRRDEVPKLRSERTGSGDVPLLPDQVGEAGGVAGPVRDQKVGAHG